MSNQKLIWHNNSRELQPRLLLFISIFRLEKEVKVGSSVRYDAKKSLLDAETGKVFVIQNYPLVRKLKV